MGKRRRTNDLTLYGEWIETLAVLLNVNWTDIARRAGIAEGTITHAARSPDNRSWAATVWSIWKVVQEMAREKGITFTASIEMGFINASDHSTDAQKDISRSILQILRNKYGMGNLADLHGTDISGAVLEAYRHEIIMLAKELERKEARITELEAKLREHS